ncbi:hypothetical protein FNV43_RR10418 [Rhamnella rubrinervis]|uniref:Myb-like domain-containing protein n=1 Tax=Rhamnella rubrinervis TaxID=2594499 RepID=A0A8K0HBT0_9ROSA|nr:hypothetical protein FNV43_RR10418 [Rhamnella rubrinervis]
MSPLRPHSDTHKQGSDERASSHVTDHVQSNKSYGDSDIMMWLKELALDTRNLDSSNGLAQKLWNQSLHVRKVLFVRYVEAQFQEYGNSAMAYGLAAKESDTPNVKKICEEISSSLISSCNNTDGFSHQLACDLQCLSSSLTSEDRYEEEPISTNVTMLDNATQHVLNTYLNESTMASFDDSVSSPDVSSSNEPDSLILQALKLWISKGDSIPKAIPMKDVNGSPQLSNFLIIEEQDLRLRKTLKLLITNNDCLPQPIIPIGPGFKAQIPEWTGSINREKVFDCVGDSKDSRWLGTQIWPPIEDIDRGKILREARKGIPNSCTYSFPKSIVKRHVREACLRLQSEIDPAFWNWKFDEIGEAVSKSWTSKEQQIFKSLVRKNPLAFGTDFWELALKHFPSKCQKSLISYYYNVFIPRWMSLQTKSSPNEIDSDEDQANE